MLYRALFACGHLRRAGGNCQSEELHHQYNTDYAHSSHRLQGREAFSAPSPGLTWTKGLPNWYWFKDFPKHPSGQPVFTWPNIVRPQGVSWIEVGGTEKEMSDWLGVPASTFPFRYNGKLPGLYAVAVKSGKGEIIIRRPSATGVLAAEPDIPLHANVTPRVDQLSSLTDQRQKKGGHKMSEPMASNINNAIKGAPVSRRWILKKHNHRDGWNRCGISAWQGAGQGGGQGNRRR